jgi:hypothetical protein
MSLGWVAATVRARASTTRRLGTGQVRALASSPSLPDALARLSTGPYGHDVHPGQTLRQAQHAVTASLLWGQRVLAGWMGPREADTMRVLAGWAEIANVDALLGSFTGQDGSLAPYQLGSLATVWPMLAATGDRADLRDALAVSPWGDPGSEDPRDIQLVMRLSWCARVNALVPGTRAWATGAAVLFVAHELAAGRTASPAVAGLVARLLGPAAAASASLDDLRAAVPTSARWVLADVAAPDDLWRAESSWWRRLDADGTRLAASPRFGLEPVLGVVAMLAADAWRVRAALEIADRGGRPLEVLDAVV